MATDRTPADDQSGTRVLVAFATKMGATAGIAAMIAEGLSSLAAALQSRIVQLFQSGPRTWMAPPLLPKDARPPKRKRPHGAEHAGPTRSHPMEQPRAGREPAQTHCKLTTR